MNEEEKILENENVENNLESEYSGKFHEKDS